MYLYIEYNCLLNNRRMKIYGLFDENDIQYLLFKYIKDYLNNIRVNNIGYICNANINKATLLKLLFKIANKPQRNDSMRRVLSNWINDHTELGHNVAFAIPSMTVCIMDEYLLYNDCSLSMCQQQPFY